MIFYPCINKGDDEDRDGIGAEASRGRWKPGADDPTDITSEPQGDIFVARAGAAPLQAEHINVCRWYSGSLRPDMGRSFFITE